MLALAVPVGDGTDEPLSDGPSSATMDYVPLVLPPPGSDEQMFGAK